MKKSIFIFYTKQLHQLSCNLADNEEAIRKYAAQLQDDDLFWLISGLKVQDRTRKTQMTRVFTENGINILIFNDL